MSSLLQLYPEDHSWMACLGLEMTPPLMCEEQKKIKLNLGPDETFLDSAGKLPAGLHFPLSQASCQWRLNQEFETAFQSHVGDVIAANKNAWASRHAPIANPPDNTAHAVKAPQVGIMLCPREHLYVASKHSRCSSLPPWKRMLLLLRVKTQALSRMARMRRKTLTCMAWFDF